MIDKINVDLHKLFANKIKLEEYFILFCLVNKDGELLLRYTTLCGTIETGVFHRLRNSGFIILKDEVNITFDSIVPTEATNELFNTHENAGFEILFKELLSTYPSKVKRLTGGTRPLHNDLARCRKLYKQTIVNNNLINSFLHKSILLCVQKYYKDHLKDNKQEFMQLLATFLSQRTWEQYLSEIDKFNNSPEQTNVDAI